MKLKAITDIAAFSASAEPALGVFGSRKWLEVYGDRLQMIGIYKDEKQLVGGFYFLHTRRYGFSFVKLPPYTPHCGLFFQSESSNRSSLSNFSKEVMQEVCRFFLGLKPALTILAFPSTIIDLQPFIWEKFKVVPNYTYRLDLRLPLEDIRANFDPKTRNVINKAVKEQVDTRENSLEPSDLYSFFVSSLQGAGANVYREELEAIITRFADPTNSFSIEAYKDGVLLGAVFCVYDNQSCYYLLGGTTRSGVQGVNALLVQKCIEKAARLGCAIFDFEGSMLKGVEKFFRGFGPALFPYYTANKGILGLELLLKFKKREVF